MPDERQFMLNRASWESMPYIDRLHLISRALLTIVEADGRDDPESRASMARHALEIIEEGVSEGHVTPFDPLTFFGEPPSIE